MKTNFTIGIDIGKDTLFIHRLPDKATLEVSNDKAGLTKLLRWLSRDKAFRVIFDPTRPYHRLLEKTLATTSLALDRLPRFNLSWRHSAQDSVYCSFGERFY